MVISEEINTYHLNDHRFTELHILVNQSILDVGIINSVQ